MSTTRVALISRSDRPEVAGKYLRFADGQVFADRDSPGPHEVVTLHELGAGRYALQAHDGKFVCAEPDGRLVVTRDAIGPWETFTSSKPLTKSDGGSADLRGKLRVDGRMFRAADGQFFRPVFASALTALAPNKPYAPFFDWCRGVGFNGVRIFAGALSWAGQTAESARAQLPRVLGAAADRGLYVELTLLTDTAAAPFDKGRHLREVREIIDGMPHVLIELANEYFHATQDGQVHDANWLRQQVPLFSTGGWPVAIGAPEADEPDPQGRWEGVGGTYGTAHLDRGRDKWNQCRRVREIEACSVAGRFPVINNEPIGAAEPGTPGQRRHDTDFFYTLNALDRLFEVGGVFHFQDGLNCSLPVGPTQQQCAAAFIRGGRALSGIADRLTYLNVGHTGSPVVSADFNEGDPDKGGVTRAYSGVAGNRGFTVLVGRDREYLPTFGNGWRATRTVDREGGCTVLEVRR